MDPPTLARSAERVNGVRTAQTTFEEKVQDHARRADAPVEGTLGV
jgi:hypothetical protein